MKLDVEDKSSIALEFLERAIELYLRGDSYYSALHLAGAAEEVLAVYVRGLAGDSAEFTESASDHLKRAFVAFTSPSSSIEQRESEKWIHDRIYEAKNSVKHKRGRKDEFVDFDPKEESADMIDLAVSTYFQLFARGQLAYLPCIEVFDARRRFERAQASSDSDSANGC